MPLYMSCKCLFLRNMSSDLKGHALSKGVKSMFSLQRSRFVLVDCHREVFREVHREGGIREPVLCGKQHLRARPGHRMRLSVHQKCHVF